MCTSYVINLDRDADKWKTICKRAGRVLTRFPAITGATASCRPWYMNPMMWGCLCSHRKLWKKAASSSKPFLILEDDCLFCDDFEAEVSVVMQTVPSDWDVVALGYVSSDVTGDALIAAAVNPFMKRRPLRRVNDDWWEPGYFIGSHCYFITPKGARKLCASDEAYHTDAVICRNRSIRLYCPATSLASQVQRTGGPRYSQDLTWKWLMVEPTFAVGPLTVRPVHLIAAYAAVVGMALSGSRFKMLAAQVAIALPVFQYLSTYSHIKHSERESRQHAKEDSPVDNSILFINGG